MAVFQDKPGKPEPVCLHLGIFLALRAKGWWRWWCYKMWKAAVKSSPPTNQHPPFYRPVALPVSQPTVSKHWRGKVSHSMDLLTPSSPGVFQTCLWQLKVPGYLGRGLPSLSSARDACFVKYWLAANADLSLAACTVRRTATTERWRRLASM